MQEEAGKIAARIETSRQNTRQVQVWTKKKKKQDKKEVKEKKK